MERFLATHAVIVVADHAQTRVEHPLALADELGDEWRVLQPNEATQTAPSSPSARAPGRRRSMSSAAATQRGGRIRGVRSRLRDLDGVDLFSWLAIDGQPVERFGGDGPPPPAAEAIVERAGAELRFRPGSRLRDRRGRGWDVAGDPAALLATAAEGRIDSETYPDALSRLWAALNAPHAGEILISAAPGLRASSTGAARLTARAAATARCTPAIRSGRCCSAASSPGPRRSASSGRSETSPGSSTIISAPPPTAASGSAYSRAGRGPRGGRVGGVR